MNMFQYIKHLCIYVQVYNKHNIINHVYIISLSLGHLFVLPSTKCQKVADQYVKMTDIMIIISNQLFPNIHNYQLM